MVTKIGYGISSASYKLKNFGVLAMNSSPRMMCVTSISRSSTMCAKLYVGYPSALMIMMSSSISSPASRSPRTESCQWYRLMSVALKRNGFVPSHSSNVSGRWSRKRNARLFSFASSRNASSSSFVYGSGYANPLSMSF